MFLTFQVVSFCILHVNPEHVVMGQPLFCQFVFLHLDVNVQPEVFACHRLHDASHNGVQPFSYGVVMQYQSPASFLAAKRGRLHFSVSDRKMVVKGIQVHQEPVQIVAQGPQHDAVAGLLDCLKEIATETLEDLLLGNACRSEIKWRQTAAFEALQERI